MANSINELLGELQNIQENDSVKLQEWCDRLCEYYEINERHWYSEITAYILSCDGGIEYMERIIPILHSMHNSLPPEKNHIRKNINKLIDHIQLEIQRIRYINDALNTSTLNAFIALHNEQTSDLKKLYESTAREVDNVKVSAKEIAEKVTNSEKELKEIYISTSNEVANVKASAKEIAEKVANSEQEITVVKSSAEEIAEKVKNSEKEYISILGIFSAVVLSFNGGMLFSSSVLENISNASIFRITLISLILGLILINVIYLLILFIVNITKMESERIWTYPKFMITINAILCSMVILVCLCWVVDIHYLANKFRNRFIY